MSRTLEIPTPNEPLLGPPTLPHFVVKQLEPQKHGVNEEDLAQAIQEIETQTQIYGASFLTLHVTDPEWKVQCSGLFRAEEDGLLNELEVEFPEGSGNFWHLCALEGSTTLSQPNLLPKFEDAVVAKMRRVWGHWTAPAGTSTRAEWIRAMVHEVNLKLHLNPPIRFVCPGVTRKEPVAESSQEKKEKHESESLHTHTGSQKKHAEESKAPGVHAGAEYTIKGATPNSEQRNLVNEVLTIAAEHNAGQLATEALLEACIAENDFTNHPGGGGGSTGLLQLIPSTAQALGVDPLNVKQTVTAFLTKTQGNAKNGAIGYAQEHPNAAAYEVAQAVQASGAGKLSNGAINYGPWAGEAAEMIHAFGGITAGGTSQHSNESDVGQLTRGTQENPDEDSWDCAVRLAQEVNWSLFTDGKNTIYYMAGQDFMRQRPKLYIDGKSAKGEQQPPGNWRIIREEPGGQKVEEYGCVLEGLTYTYDNTSFLYRATHKVKQKVQRRSRVSKPQTPAQVRMDLLCGINEYRAGDLFVFRNTGPMSENGGRWIVADATREPMKYPYTKFILVPPTEPLPEPKGEANPSSFTPGGPINGATNPAPGATWGRLDMGFDGNYGGEGAVAPYDGTVHVPGIAGWPGEGVYFYIVNDNQSGPDYTRAMYFAEGAKPIVKDGAHVTAGTPIGKRVAHGGTGALGNFEIGPAKTDNGDCLVKAYGLNSDKSKKTVLAFAAWLQTLGASTPTDISAAGGP